jgi:hypothetical protein
MGVVEGINKAAGILCGDELFPKKRVRIDAETAYLTRRRLPSCVPSIHAP